MFKLLQKKREALKAKNEEIKAKRAEAEVDNATLEALKKVNEELTALTEERDAIQSEIDEILDAIAQTGKPTADAEDEAEAEPTEEQPTEAEGFRSMNVKNINEHEIERTIPMVAGEQEKNIERMNKMGEDLKNRRSVTVASGSLLVPTHYKNEIEGTYQQYSSIVDRVNQIALNGGESYKAPYEIGVEEGEIGTEGTAPNGSNETQFGYANINKVKITAYAELSEETKKLPNANYAERVLEGVKTAIKKKVASQILTGAGDADSFVGIFSKGDANKCVLTADDVTINAIDENTLTTLIGAVGGDEAIEGAITLILSKKDLLKFAQLRDPATGAKIHDVNFTAQTIDGVPYIISSKCKPVETASAGDYVMCAGILSSYEEAIFSNIEIQESTDYKFKEGMICYRGVVFAGGNTTKYRGFVRAKKG